MISNENISFFYVDNNIEDVPDNDKDINEIMNELKNMQYEYEINNDSTINLEKYNVKELLKICDYYGFLKNVKLAKYKKNDIIQAIEMFEKNPANFLIVQKRQELWYFMNELCNDKFMKKYVNWNF